MQPAPIVSHRLRNLEKILIIVLLFSILFFYFVLGEKELKASLLYPFVLVIELALIALYSYLIRNWYVVFFAGYTSFVVGNLLLYMQVAFGSHLVLLGELSQLGLGLFFGYKTILESIANKDFELYGTLIALELMFPVVNRYLLPGDELTLIYSFALPFVLGIIMYNDNLWDKYNSSEKKLLTYILVSTIAEVLFISVRLI